MELTAKQIYNSVDAWYKTKFKEQGYTASFISVASMMSGITAYDYLLTPLDKSRIKRAASVLKPLLHEYANNPNMTFDIDVLLRHMPAFKMELFGKRYGFADQNADSPLTDPVAAWLAEILRPRNINHISDPISDVIAAAIDEGTAWHDKTPAALVKQAATLLSTLHAYNKGQVQFSVGQTETTAERGFREALHRLVDASAEPDPDNWDEGDPMRDPVVKWLAETLRPDSINWTLGDHVHCVLISAMQRKGESAASSSAIRAARELYEIRTRYSNKRSTAAIIDYVEPIRTGFVQGGFIPAKQDEETTMQRGFREALHRLVDASADPDPKVFSRTLLTEFGERLRLSNKVPHFMGVVERDTLAHVDSSGRHSVLWASTGGFIYRAVPSHGRELIDWQHPDNVAHLQACYNAHNTPLGDTHPCSHFTSRPH